MDNITLYARKQDRLDRHLINLPQRENAVISTCLKIRLITYLFIPLFKSSQTCATGGVVDVNAVRE
jgi:hypothetical protein